MINIKSSRQSVDTGTVWEKTAGFCRAVRMGNRILVAGTTATDPEGIVGKGDLTKQTYYVLDKIERAIKELGGTFEDVVLTRIYVSDIKHWEIVAKIHGEKFKNIRPVTTLIQAILVPDCLVEVEAEAIIAET